MCLKAGVHITICFVMYQRAQFRVETDKNLQLAHTESKAASKLQWEIDTLQDDLARVENLVQEQQREREQHYNNVKVSYIMDTSQMYVGAQLLNTHFPTLSFVLFRLNDSLPFARQNKFVLFRINDPLPYVVLVITVKLQQ